MNYSWFASAYDTDDWLFRLATMVQMVGVIVLSLGLPQMFASIDHGDTLDNGVMVAGYVVMRVALLFLWWQVVPARPGAGAGGALLHDDDRHRPGRLGRARLPRPPDRATFAAISSCSRSRSLGPFLAERKAQTPWHPSTSRSATGCW